MLNHAHLTIRCTGHDDFDEYEQDHLRFRIDLWPLSDSHITLMSNRFLDFEQLKTPVSIRDYTDELWENI